MIISLEDSKTVLVAYHTNDPNAGMSLSRDISRYKLFAADTGLFVTMAFWDSDFSETQSTRNFWQTSSTPTSATSTKTLWHRC